jgi:hypothetical protein
MRYRSFYNLNIFFFFLHINNFFFLHYQAKSYSIKYSDNTLSIYGLTQNPNTKDYIMVLEDEYCEKCGNQYTQKQKFRKWCKQCQINGLKENFKYWTSENEKVDNFIKEMQLKINSCNDIVVEWIPYDHFDNIKKIGTGGFATVYLATWKDGLLQYNNYRKEYERFSNEWVALKCLHNSQNITNEFLNEV